MTSALKKNRKQLTDSLDLPLPHHMHMDDDGRDSHEEKLSSLAGGEGALNPSGDAATPNAGGATAAAISAAPSAAPTAPTTISSGVTDKKTPRTPQIISCRPQNLPPPIIQSLLLQLQATAPSPPALTVAAGVLPLRQSLRTASPQEAVPLPPHLLGKTGPVVSFSENDGERLRRLTISSQPSSANIHTTLGPPLRKPLVTISRKNSQLTDMFTALPQGALATLSPRVLSPIDPQASPKLPSPVIGTSFKPKFMTSPLPPPVAID